MSCRTIAMRTRAGVPGAARHPSVLYREWDAARAAVVVCDMWDAHHCASALHRVVEMVPRMNEVLARLRARGALIVHAPADCMDFYHDTPARRRAALAPHVDASARIDWCDWEPDELAGLPATLTDPGPCSCSSSQPCGDRFRAWTRQIGVIEVLQEDAVTDDGQELFNLLEQRGIADVLVMGVHTNGCVLGRPYGIRQLVYWGKRPVLCRDLTDAFHRDSRGHDWGTEQVIAHIERRWCPTVTSDQLVGGVPFRFSDAAWAGPVHNRAT
jgi:nicotinamidase-related amidase